jgi:hypothetical protein
MKDIDFVALTRNDSLYIKSDISPQERATLCYKAFQTILRPDLHKPPLILPLLVSIRQHYVRAKCVVTRLSPVDTID